MFKRLKLRIRDTRTISKLIPGADKQALLMGETSPGAEHFMLSAFELSDNTARNIFKRMNKTPEDFKTAIQTQYNNALAELGINITVDAGQLEAVAEPVSLNKSKASGKELMKNLHALKKADKDRPLLGAHVVKVIAGMEHGVAIRALRVLGIEKAALLQAAEAELNAYES